MSTNGNGKTPELPCNIEAEEALLGAAIIGGTEAIAEIDPPMKATDFFRETHGKLWEIMTGLDEVDIQTIWDSANLAGLHIPYTDLSRMAAGVPTWTHIQSYAATVRRAAYDRALILVSQMNAQEAYQSGTSLEERIQHSIRRLESVIAPDSDRATLEWERTFDAWNEGQLERSAQRGQPKIDLPWSSLSYVRPLRPSMLAVVAACPGIGKTTFAENCAEHWAQDGFRVAFFHFELSHQIMLDRRMARWSGEDMPILESGELTQAMQRADELLQSWAGKIHYVHCDGWTMAQVCNRARSMMRRGMAEVVVIDYLHKAKLRETIKGLNVAQMRGQDAETAKHLAEGGIPVMLLAQMNREADSASRKTKSTIRDTGEIAEKANLVITLDRPILDDDRSFAGFTFKAGSYSPEMTVRIDKQTLGATGEEKLLMNPRRFIIADKA